MQHILSIEDIKRRAEAIGVKPEQLCRLAGVAPSTISRALRGKTRDSWVSTRVRLIRALEEREREVLAHLRPLHPEERAA